MVLAAGLGTRLRPLTNEITKPMVPVLDRPVMGHILDLLDRHGFEEVVANLHYFPEAIGHLIELRRIVRALPQAHGLGGDAPSVRRKAPEELPVQAKHEC